MTPELLTLNLRRDHLNNVLDQWDTNWVKDNWLDVKGRITGWWTAYKVWETKDTFDEAFHDDRMTVRSFSPDFAYEVSKTIAPGTIGIAPDRFYANSGYANLSDLDQKAHAANFTQANEHNKYWAERGIDSSAFANPANFASREKKYAEGLHDLSASLLNHNYKIMDQVHHKTDDGAHFAFLPLSPEADQEVIFRLARYAKDRVTIPELYPMVRGFRAEMTRLKLADPEDAGTGMTAVPAPRGGTGPQYKMRYGSKTLAGYAVRKAAARKFKGILARRPGLKNEVVIAIRQHAGPFPVYAVRNGNRFKCYDIVRKAMTLNGDEISPDGHLTHTYLVERGAAGLPVTKPAKIVPYNVPNLPGVQAVIAAPRVPGLPGPPPPPPPGGRVGQPQALPPRQIDSAFRSRLDEALRDMGEIPKRSGLRVFVISPRYDDTFRHALADVQNQVHDLNTKGFRLSVAALPNRTECQGVEVRLYYF